MVIHEYGLQLHAMGLAFDQPVWRGAGGSGVVTARQGLSMAINFPNASRSYDVTRNAVHFWGHDQSMETSFFISADALQRLAPGAANNESDLLAAFDRNRPRICEAAAKIYGRGQKGGSYDLHASNF